LRGLPADEVPALRSLTFGPFSPLDRRRAFAEFRDGGCKAHGRPTGPFRVGDHDLNFPENISWSMNLKGDKASAIKIRHFVGIFVMGAR